MKEPGTIPVLLWFAGIFIIVIVLLASITIIPAGHVGVYDLFGKVSEEELSAGLHIVNPLARIHKLSVQTQEIKETAIVPSKEGLSVSLDVSILYRLMPDKAAELYRTVGYNYLDVVVAPQVRSAIRGVTVNHEAKALYTAEREIIADAITHDLTPALNQRGIVLEKALLREIRLPEMVSKAIEIKLSAEQDAQKMKFVLEREKLEADRKRTEAQGISDANKIIAGSLTTNYLTWYWISNLDKSKSVMYVPVGNNGLPLFKNVDES